MRYQLKKEDKSDFTKQGGGHMCFDGSTDRSGKIQRAAGCGIIAASYGRAIGSRIVNGKRRGNSGSQGYSKVGSACALINTYIIDRDRGSIIIGDRSGSLGIADGDVVDLTNLQRGRIGHADRGHEGDDVGPTRVVGVARVVPVPVSSPGPGLLVRLIDGVLQAERLEEALAQLPVDRLSLDGFGDLAQLIDCLGQIIPWIRVLGMVEREAA